MSLKLWGIYLIRRIARGLIKIQHGIKVNGYTYYAKSIFKKLSEMIFESDKKYTFTGETKWHNIRKLHQIIAIKDFGDVKAGDIGGWVESYNNLSHGGRCWVYDNAIVLGKARVSGNAQISDNALVNRNAIVKGNARVYGNALVGDNALVRGGARVKDDAVAYGNAIIAGKANIYDNTRVFGDAVVGGKAKICETASVGGNTLVKGSAIINGNMTIKAGVH